MIRHCVLLKFVDDVTAEQRQALMDGLRELPAAIPEIADYRFGDDAGLGDGNWDFAVTADFADEAAYEVYAGHPDHVGVIVDRIKPILADRAAAQFHLDA